MKSARDALGTAALDPDGAGARSSGLLSKSLRLAKARETRVGSRWCSLGLVRRRLVSKMS